MAGRSMPGSVLRTNLAVPMRAPVLPAETQACARPSFTRSMATRMEEFFLVRIAVRTSSSMATTSAACTTVARAAWGEATRASSRRSGSSCPTRSNCASGCAARKSRLAGTVTFGPWSPPIASTAMTVFIASSAMNGPLVLGLDDLLAAVVARRRDGVAQVRLARGGLDGDRRLGQVIVRTVHAAFRRRLLVLLNGHVAILLGIRHFAFLRPASAAKGDSFRGD